MSETKIVYRVKGNRGSWDYVLDSLEAGRSYLKHIRETFDKSAKLYKVTQKWEVVK